MFEILLLVNEEHFQKIKSNFVWDFREHVMEYTNPQEAKTLLKINGIFSFALSLGGIFLQVFLFTLGGFRAVVEYNLISALMVVIFYIISGWLLTWISLKKCLLLGMSAHILLFSLLFLFREQSRALLIPLGMVHGIAIGIFWGAMTSLQYIFTTDETRYRFFGHQSFLFSITGGIAPIIGGALISLSGFLISKEFGYSFVFFLIAVLMAYCYREAKKLPEHEPIDFSFIYVIRHRRSKVWKLALLHDFFYGLFDFMFISFTAIIMFLILKSEFLLGVVNGVGAIFAAGTGLLAGVILAKRKTSFVPAALIAAMGMAFLAWQQNWWGLIAFMFLFHTAMPLLNVASWKMLFDMLERSKKEWQKTYYLFLEREIMLGMGRIASLLIFFLVVSDQNQFKTARIAVGLLAIVLVCIGFILRRITVSTDN